MQKKMQDQNNRYVRLKQLADQDENKYKASDLEGLFGAKLDEIIKKENEEIEALKSNTTTANQTDLVAQFALDNPMPIKYPMNESDLMDNFND